MELRRLSLDLFEARKRSGEVCVGDIAVLQTLPQGVARLATLQMQEHMRARKTKNSVGASSSGNISLEPAVKNHARFKNILGEKALVLQSTLMARRLPHPLRWRSLVARSGLQLPMRKMAFGFSKTT